MRRTAATGLVMADLGAVVALRPPVATVAATLARPRVALATRGVDGALVPVFTAVVWLAAVWLALGLAALAAARLPGLAGRVGAGLAGRLLPRTVRSLVGGSAAVGLLLAPVAAAAAPAPTPGAHHPAPAWPLTSTSAPAWPTGATAPRPPHAPRRPHGHRPATAQTATLTVRPGDSLWTIAGARLGPAATPARVAREWPRWFAANRAVIGADPALIRPGQVLQAPAAPQSPDPSSPEARR